jgi:hypothetical protein
MRKVKLEIIKTLTVATKRMILFSTTGSGVPFKTSTPEKTKFPNSIHSEVIVIKGKRKYLYHIGK